MHTRDFFFIVSTEPHFWVKLWTLRRVMRPWSTPDTYSITKPHPRIPTPQWRHQMCARARLIASPNMKLLINKLQTTQKNTRVLLFTKTWFNNSVRDHTIQLKQSMCHRVDRILVKGFHCFWSTEWQFFYLSGELTAILLVALHIPHRPVTTTGVRY